MGVKALTRTQGNVPTNMELACVIPVGYPMGRFGPVYPATGGRDRQLGSVRRLIVRSTGKDPSIISTRSILASIHRGFDSYRAYYRSVPKGRTTLRYDVRYNTAGTFQLPPTHVEAMCAPEIHADVPVKTTTERQRHLAGDDKHRP